MSIQNWPTADSINARIALSAASNQRPAIALTDTGKLFLKYGRQYGINPGFVIAIMQKESQLGADGSFLPRYHNFAGITDPYSLRSTCHPITYKDRQWACYHSVADGIEAVFKVLDAPIYRRTGGTIQAILDVYSPSYENNTAQMLRIIEIVGRQLNIQLKPHTQIYGGKALWRQVIRKR